MNGAHLQIAGAVRPSARLTGILALLFLSSCAPRPFPGKENRPQRAFVAPDGGVHLDLDQLELELAEAVNRARVAHGLKPLAWDEEFLPVARAHSEDMALNAFYDHVNRRGDDADRRAKRRGLVCTSDYPLLKGMGENLSAVYWHASYEMTYQGGASSVAYTWRTMPDIVEEVVSAWMASPAHRGNLLDASFKTQSIGIALSAERQLFITQNLC